MAATIKAQNISKVEDLQCFLKLIFLKIMNSRKTRFADSYLAYKSLYEPSIESNKIKYVLDKSVSTNKSVCINQYKLI